MPSRAKKHFQHFANQVRNAKQFAAADYETNVQNTHTTLTNRKTSEN